MQDDFINKELEEVSKVAVDFITSTAKEKRYGDVSVLITFDEGFPVKITTSYCEHRAKRNKTRWSVVEK